ncbi:MAG TPA: ferritin family protein [Longimicrobiales bacterium]
MSDDALRLLRTARAAEKEQALFYRSLTGQAETAGDAALAERLNGLLADEQHHLSRLTARLLELGQDVDDLADMAVPAADLASWQTIARDRELVEIARYELLLGADLDETTRGLVEDILQTERNHERELGGKWMMA